MKLCLILISAIYYRFNAISIVFYVFNILCSVGSGSTIVKISLVYIFLRNIFIYIMHLCSHLVAVLWNALELDKIEYELVRDWEFCSEGMQCNQFI